VTRAQFAAFVEAANYGPASGCTTLDGIRAEEALSWKDPGFPQSDNEPVVCVS
jgi:hypothetical protein